MANAVYFKIHVGKLSGPEAFPRFKLDNCLYSTHLQEKSNISEQFLQQSHNPIHYSLQEAVVVGYY
jgi:hypothetical protein